MHRGQSVYLQSARPLPRVSKVWETVRQGGQGGWGVIEACIDFMSWVESQGREHVMDGGEMGPGTASLDLKYRDLPVPSPLMPTPASINLKTWTLP